MNHHDIAIIGSGFAGIGAAIRLRQEGRTDFVVLEKADGIGGTWRDNSYPGCACDVQSHLYSFSFAQNPDWTRMYAGYAEIRAYMEGCVDRFGVRPHVRCNAEVTGARWDEEAAVWRLQVNGAEELTARAVIAGLGGLSRPAFPDLDGLAEFEGPVLHSARWDHGVDLDGKRVVVVGTGASAIQLVPQIRRRAANVTVFQRTPPWVLPKPDHPMPRAVRRLFRVAPFLQRALRGAIFAGQESVALGTARYPALMRAGELVGRAYVRRTITDPALRAKVTPSYRLGCKRILVSNDYYPALARDNVDVVTEGITRVTRGGVVDRAGEAHPADVLVLATGFQVTNPIGDAVIEGRGGRKLGEEWAASGMAAHMGTTVNGYPNLFLIVGPNTGTGHNSQILMIEHQVEYILRALKAIDAAGAVALDTRAEAQASYNAWIQQRMARTVWTTGGCNSWYLDEHGRNVTLWPGFTFEFKRLTRTFDPGRHEFIEQPAAVPVAA
ncbi:MAG TPA: NAD(P)/FAD-dependent oxidoreductase [Solirubrobacteraceae bacterium]